MRAAAAFALWLFCAGALAQTIEATNADERAILALRTAFNEAIARNDSAAIRAFLDESFQITTGAGEQLLHSADDEVKTWRDFFDSFSDVIYIRSPTVIEVSDYLPRALEFGTWTGHAKKTDESRQFSGRYAAAWNKVDGQWKVASELYVTLDCDGDDCANENK